MHESWSAGELAGLRASESELESELCTTREQARQLSKDLEEMVGLEQSIRREKRAVEEEASKVSEEMESLSAEHDRLVSELKTQYDELNKKHKDALEENLNLKEDKMVSDRAKVNCTTSIHFA